MEKLKETSVQRGGEKEITNIRKVQFREKFKRLVEKGNLYDKHRETVLTLGDLPPKKSSFYDKFDEFVMPKTEGMTEKEVEKKIIQEWNSWYSLNKPKPQIEKIENENQKQKRGTDFLIGGRCSGLFSRFGN